MSQEKRKIISMGKIFLAAGVLCFAVIPVPGLDTASGGELKKLEVEKPKKLDLKKPEIKKPALKKSKPKLKKIAPKKTPKKLDKKIARPKTDSIKKLNIKPGGDKQLSRSIDKASINKQPPGLDPDIVKPRSEPLASELKSIKQLPAPSAETGKIRSTGVDNLANIDDGTGVRIDPNLDLSKALVAPSLKDSVVRPRIKESIDRESLGAKLDGDSPIKGNLQGLGRDKGSSVGDRAGVGGKLGGESNLEKGLKESLSKHSGPDPVSRRSRTTDFDFDSYRERIGIAGGKGYVDQRTDHWVNVIVLTETEAEGAGLATYDKNLGTVIDDESLMETHETDSSHGTSYITIVVSDEATEKEKRESVKAWADQVRGTPPPDLVPLVSDDQDDGGDTASSESDDGSDVGENSSDQQQDDNVSNSTGGEESSDTADNSGGSSEDNADAESESGASDTAANDGNDSEDSAGSDSDCPEGQEDCGTADMEGDDEGARTVEGGQEDLDGCEPGVNCRDTQPENRGDDGTVRTAEDEGKGGPLKGDTDTSAADGTLRVANEEPVGELVRGEGVLQGAGDGTLRLPEGEDDDGGGTPQIAGDTGGGPIGDPGVVTDDIGAAGQLGAQNVEIQSGELNVDQQAVENLDGVSNQ